MPNPEPDPPCRFQVRSSTIRDNRLAGIAFRFGGTAILLMVFGILVFIVLEVAPLFQGAEVKPSVTRAATGEHFVLMGVDEWAEYPFLMSAQGAFHFFDLEGSEAPEIIQPIDSEANAPVAWRYHQEREIVALASASGECQLLQIDYQPIFGESGKRDGVQVKIDGLIRLNTGAEGEIFALDFDQTERRGLLAGIDKSSSGWRLRAVTYQRQVGLLQASEWKQGKVSELTSYLNGRPERLLVGGHAETIIVATDSGLIDVFQRNGNTIEWIESFRPFANEGVALIEWLAGRRSLLIGSTSGKLSLYSPFPDPETGRMSYALARELSPLSGEPTLYAASVRNRVFLIGSGQKVSLRYGTTGARLWQESLPFTPKFGLIGSRYKSLLFLDSKDAFHRFSLDDPHPEASFVGFFGKVRYEGQSTDRYVWQSTGGGDAFEPKLSLVPLIVGTLKGTLYAMLFAVPIALAAALYSAQFLSQRVRRVVKPSMEIMASLPSVVLGFLAALWLAPLIDEHIPSVLLGLFFVPLFAILAGLFWRNVPARIREHLPEGREFLPMIPLVLLAMVLGWWLGPFLERLLFSVTDPVTGQSVADFRLWWQERLGLQFEQRNALVVGFMMGFAVIPIIFTLSEDAMANVPPSLVSGSLALGAGRWETARYIVLPMALPGMFSALMIGFGRAVGETMIVVMATGNTPLTDLNLFSGMRTLAANIAVELPEAPLHSTLYRTLFLGAMLLFIMTFAVNTLAEITRERIRQRYQKTT